MAALSAIVVFAGNAGDRAGNGGDAVVCDDTKTAYLLDYIEANFRGMPLDLGDPSLTVRELVNNQLNKIAKFDLEREEPLAWLGDITS